MLSLYEITQLHYSVGQIMHMIKSLLQEIKGIH